MLLILSIATFSLSAQTITEKKASLSSGSTGLDPETEQFLLQVNREILEHKLEIDRLYDQVWSLYESHASPFEYRNLLEAINDNKKQVRRLENTWRELASVGNVKDEYGLWHAPETTLEQLVIDYGSQDYVYLISPDVGSIRLSVNSNIPIPRSSWSEMLELILNQNGVGIRSLNPYLRQLYLTQQDHSNVAMITNRREDLDLLPSDARVTFVISPEPSDVRRAYLFLEKFINPTTTVLATLGRDILVIAQNSDVQDLLKLYDFVAKNRGDKEYRLVPVHKAKVDEMAKILGAMFDQNVDSSGGFAPDAATGQGGAITTKPGFSEANGLKVVILESMARALFLVGTKEELHKAEEIIHNVESRIGGARDRVIFWYSVKHSDPEDLAEVLSKVYSLMITTGAGFPSQNQGNGNGGPPGGPPLNVNNETINVNQEGPDIVAPPLVNQLQPPLSLYGPEGFYQEGAYVYNPAPIQPGILLEREPNQNRDNFIVDLKTGSMVMVVEAEVLPKIKELLRRLDVPKKMVHIETLLFEKRLKRSNHYGLNLLRFGDFASQTHETGGFFNYTDLLPTPGIFEFLISRKKSDGTPAFDLIYRFLMSQDDVQINSTPSIMTVNQTPAQIAILEEISVNTGIFVVDTAKGNSLKDAFTRSQYGITLNITPTIHMRDENEEGFCDDAYDYDYVTIDADITFDTIQSDFNNRPNVLRRHLVNQVQIPDGQSVILGGLRRKNTQDVKQGIPFIGEVPYLGKLFSETDLTDDSSEMFIFITPHIIKDPATELDRLRQELLCLRPGDEPYFLKCVEDAHRFEKNRLMQGGMTILFGRPRPDYYVPIGEYDGFGIDDCIPY